MKEKIVKFQISIVILTFLVISFLFVNLEKVWADSLLTNIEVGDMPEYIEFNPSNNNIYVTNRESDDISVIDSSTNTVIDTIEVGDLPADLEFNPVNDNNYEAVRGTGNVLVIESSTNTVVDTIEIGNNPYVIKFNPNDDNIYVTNAVNLSIIDSSTNNIVDSIEVGDFPYDFVFNPNDNIMYVGNLNSHDVSVIDTASNTVIDTIEVGETPFTLKFNPNNNNIYVANRASDDVSVIDTASNTVIDTIEVGNNPQFLELNPNNNNIYVANYLGTKVSVIDTSSNTVIKTLDVGSSPYFLEYNPNNNNIYVANSGSNDISIIDGTTNTVIDTIDVGDTPVAIEFNPSNNNMYSANFNSQDVSVIGNPSPIADAGPDQTVQSGDLVQLDGTGSSANGGSPIVEYQWTQIEGRSVTLDDPNSATPTFMAPDAEEQVNLGFHLVVTNDQGVESEPDSVTITVNPVIPPIADAGHDQVVQSEDLVELNGSNSSDPNGSTLTYSWIQTEGQEVTLSDATSSNPTFEAPKTNEEINLVFQLTVTNEEGITSEPDEVIVTVNPVSMPPPPPSEEEPRTINDIIRSIIKNPLNVTNSVESSNEIRELLTDNNQDNDKIVCNLLNVQGDDIREILKC